MAFFRKNEAVICLFAGLALSLALGIGLSIPAWGLYVQIKDLGPGGVGSEAQAETRSKRPGTTRRASTCWTLITGSLL